MKITKSVLIALAVGYIHPLLGILAFFVASAVLSGGSPGGSVPATRSSHINSPLMTFNSSPHDYDSTTEL